MEFKEFKIKLQNHFETLIKNETHLFLTAVDKDKMWEEFISCFEGDEVTSHTCSSCRNFIKQYGNVVAIKDNKIVTFWDVGVTDSIYEPVVSKMSRLVRKAQIRDIFLSTFPKLGTDKNKQQLESGTIVTWNHFHYKLPNQFLINDRRTSVESKQGIARSNKEVFKRSLETITMDALETALDLISQNSVYRLSESKGVLSIFKSLKVAYEKLKNEQEKNVFCWTKSLSNGSHVAKIRNTAVGTFLINLSEGMDLTRAADAFEKIMAPTNYKRPDGALMTKKGIEKLQKKLDELGYLPSLGRRFATLSDIKVNNLLYVDRDVTGGPQDIFEELTESLTINPKTFNKVEEVPIDKFIKEVLPNITGMEILVEGNHISNFVSLIAPKDENAPSMFKWDNGFSWVYNNELADSMKERVKSAGGSVDGELRISLEWFNYDDLDLHVIEPDGNKIFYSSKRSRTSDGTLDVDMNAGGRNSRSPVENIIFTDRRQMLEGTYKVIVHNYNKRENNNVGFNVEVECRNELFDFSHSKAVRNEQRISVCEFTYNKDTGIAFKNGIESSTTSKDVWGIKTNSFQKVSIMLESPNHWDELGIGNKHFFFMIPEVKNEEATRGFFNEFLKEELMEHRRVFESLASKMRVEPTAEQLSGIGFSSTQKNEVICKVEGSFTRTLKIKF